MQAGTLAYNMTIPLKFYVSRKDYSVMSGPDWPTYENYLSGANSILPEVDAEIKNWTTGLVKDGMNFPIDTKTACVYKWSWSTIYLNMLSTASCHRAGTMKFTIDEFDNFHNLPKKQQDRRDMLAGEWPDGGCYYCQSIEEAGGESDRTLSLGTRGLTPLELVTNPSAVSVSPRIIEIFAQNTCNLACVYCNDTLSSRIEIENKKHGEFDSNGVKIPISDTSDANSDQYFDRFIEWLEKNINTLQRLHLLGGETFIQHKLMTRVLDIIERNPNPDLELCTFSNFNVPSKPWYSYIERIKGLQRSGNIRIFDLTASIDCWGPEQQYVRNGLDLDKFEKYFAWAVDQDESWLRLNVNQTITSMTIRTMPELIKKIVHYSQKRKIGHYFQFLGPSLNLPGHDSMQCQHPRQFAYRHWHDDFERIFSVMPDQTEEHLEARERMTGIQRMLQQQTEHNYTGISQLHTYLDELDRRRGTDWRSLFPYLDIKE